MGPGICFSVWREGKSRFRMAGRSLGSTARPTIRPPPTFEWMPARSDRAAARAGRDDRRKARSRALRPCRWCRTMPRGHGQFAMLAEPCAAQFRNYASALHDAIEAQRARSQTVQDALGGQWIVKGDEVDDLQQVVAGLSGPLDAPLSQACGLRDARSSALAPMQKPLRS